MNDTLDNMPEGGPDIVAAVGDFGPMLSHGLPYGAGNRHRPPTSGPPTGDPGPALRGKLTQRNDDIFASVECRDDHTGKTVVAWHDKEGALWVGMVKDHDQGQPGETYTRLTHLLAAAGFTDAVFFDGSDSAMIRYKGRLVMAPGTYKANTMTVAVGFVSFSDAEAASPVTARLSAGRLVLVCGCVLLSVLVIGWTSPGARPPPSGCHAAARRRPWCR